MKFSELANFVVLWPLTLILCVLSHIFVEILASSIINIQVRGQNGIVKIIFFLQNYCGWCLTLTLARFETQIDLGNLNNKLAKLTKILYFYLGAQLTFLLKLVLNLLMRIAFLCKKKYMDKEN